jgi:hypothetical protein
LYFFGVQIAQHNENRKLTFSWGFFGTYGYGLSRVGVDEEAWMERLRG